MSKTKEKNTKYKLLYVYICSNTQGANTVFPSSAKENRKKTRTILHVIRAHTHARRGV